MTDIFLSYSSKDREKVRPFQQALEAFGYKVFWDLETPIGQDWDEWIRSEIVKAKLVIVFWTKNSAGSRNVRHEVAIAFESNKLIPALLEPMKAIDFPMGFYTTQGAVVHDWDGKATHAGYAKLVRAVRQRFEGTAQEVAEVARKENETELEALTRKANAGDSGAQVQLGYLYLEGQGVEKNEKEAVRLHSIAAANGIAIAQRSLGYMYSYGLGGLKQNYEEAARLFELAADQGEPDAIFNLAFAYANGQGVKKNEPEAMRLYRLAADKGHAAALSNLGLMHELGNGVKKDEREAARLYRLAADLGNSVGRTNLAELYEYGKGGLPKDLVEAVRLYKLAAEQGNSYAAEALKRLGK